MQIREYLRSEEGTTDQTQLYVNRLGLTVSLPLKFLILYRLREIVIVGLWLLLRGILLSAGARATKREKAESILRTYL